MRLHAVLLLAAVPVLAQPPAERLHKLFEAEWERTLRDSPIFASELGDKRYNDRWPDLTPQAAQQRSVARQAALRQLASIEYTALTPADRLNYDLFRRSYQEEEEEFALGWHYMPVNSYSGIQGIARTGEAIRYERVKDYEDWLTRLRTFPVYAAQTVALMRDGISRKLVQPRMVTARVIAQLERQIVSDAEKSPYYAPFTQWIPGIPEIDRVRLQREAKEAIQVQVTPALREVLRFLKEEYSPVGYEQPGIWNLPDGGKLYAFFVRQHTTTRLTPDEIHQIGLREVARIKDEMYGVLRRVGFQGTLPEFFQHLRTDPKFFYREPGELLDAYRALAKRVDPRLVRLFRILPRTPYGAEPIPAELAPDTTTAYYMPPAADGSRAGTFYVNLYKPETRPKWEMTALTLHEAVPGHHLQIARAQELPEVPPFRRQLGFTAYVEGWGLYAESLGDELGLYDDPYSKFGQLTYEMWRAVRLVVDTGIHQKRWSRQQAIDYFMANAPKSELDVTNEVDRYIGWPGQALAYKVGELKIKELRSRAQARLGAQFDARSFHEAVLNQGALPLEVLERIVEEWITTAGSRKP